MPRRSMLKGGEEVAPRSGVASPGEPFPPRRRRQRSLLEDPACGRSNENERRHLLPLLDQLAARGRVPAELWADRGYHAKALLDELQQRKIEPHISKPRRAGDPIPPGTPTRTVYRGKQKRVKTARPRAPPPLADRTHQRLAPQLPTDRNPTRPQSHRLPRIHPPRDDRHPHQGILSSLPVPERVQGNACPREPWRDGPRPNERPARRTREQRTVFSSKFLGGALSAPAPSSQRGLGVSSSG